MRGERIRSAAKKFSTAAAVSALLLGTACTASGSGSLEDFYRQTVQWGSCAGFHNGDGLVQAGLQCAKVRVPLDYDKPGGATAQIALSRFQARGQRVGSLLTNPGGPGGVGLVYPLMLAQTDLAYSFDLIGIDVRGLGDSTPRVVCSTEQERLADRADPDVDYSPAGIAQTEQEYRDYAARCVERTGLEVLSHVGTADVARDFDIIRAVLGDPKLNYFGGSYGTRLGSTIAELFPDRIRAMVLDGGLDPEADIGDPVPRAAAFQRAFETYAADCAATPGCPLGADPAAAPKALRALVDPLIDRPAATADARGLGYNDAMNGVVSALYSPTEWWRITKGLTEVSQGRGDTLLEFADLMNSPDVVDGDVYTAVLCLEEARITDRAVVADLDRRSRAAAPAFDDGRATGQAPLDVCAFWPVPTAWRPHTADYPGLPTAVVVSTTGDPATPHPGGVALARTLHASLITYDGTQHGAFGRGSACVDEPVIRYLVSLSPPASELYCPHVA
ncbi:alpha/beta hydrolase family protein [Nocardia tenerifensis]|uniref:Alpha/beta hydrolase family protein n=1 Tax=Nocardia tenerifensis TaxID=228006 RepID=A0A318KEW4_9NOCA|nr:alpha/beta hydrolase [Nocardia tenerifensis]PXX71359.1 alpha/beta hydrolase family protein [Nocardia tenerifensis]